MGMSDNANASQHDDHEEEQQTSSKGGFIGILVTILVIILACAGGWYIYTNVYKKGSGEAASAEGKKSEMKTPKAEQLIHLDNGLKQDLGSGLAEKKKEKKKSETKRVNLKETANLL